MGTCFIFDNGDMFHFAGASGLVAAVVKRNMSPLSKMKHVPISRPPENHNPGETA
jgi:hypothetical protein